MADGYVLIDTGIKTDGISRGVSVIEKELARLEADYKKAESAASSLNKQAEMQKATVDATEAKYRKLSATNAQAAETISVILEKQKADLDAINEKYAAQQATLASINEQRANLQAEMQAAVAQAQMQAEAQERTASAQEREAAAQEQSTAAQEREAEAQERSAAAQEESTASQEHATEAAQETADTQEEFGDELNEDLEALKQLVALFGVMPHSISQSTAQVQKTNSGIKDAIKGVLKYGIGIGTSVALFNKLRSAAIDGLKTFAATNAEAKASLDKINAAMAQIKYALGGLIAPIVQLLAPVIAWISDAITDIVNGIRWLFAAIKGDSSYKKIQKLGDYYSGVQESAEGTSAAVKEMQRNLSGLDEINTFEKQNASYGGGGGGSAGSTGSKASEVDTPMGTKAEQLETIFRTLMPESVESMADKIIAKFFGEGKDLTWFFENYLSSPDTFYDLLTLLRNNLPDWAKLFLPIESIWAIIDKQFGGNGNDAPNGETTITDPIATALKKFVQEHTKLQPGKPDTELFELTEDDGKVIWDGKELPSAAEVLTDLRERGYLDGELTQEEIKAEIRKKNEERRKLKDYDDVFNPKEEENPWGLPSAKEIEKEFAKSKAENGRYRPVDAFANRKVLNMPHEVTMERAYGIEPKNIQTVTRKAYRTISTFYNKTKDRFLDLGEDTTEASRGATEALDTFYNRTRTRFAQIETDAGKTSRGVKSAVEKPFENDALGDYADSIYGGVKEKFEGENNPAYYFGDKSTETLDAVENPYRENKLGSYFSSVYQGVKNTVTGENDPSTVFGNKSEATVDKIKAPFENNTLGAFFGGTYDSVKKVVAGTNSPDVVFGTKAAAGVNAVKTNVNNGKLGSYFASVYKGVTDTVSGTNDPATVFGNKAKSAVPKVKAPYENNTLGKFFGGVYDEIRANFNGQNSPDVVFGNKFQGGADELTKPFENVPKKFSDIKNSIGDAFKGAWGSVTGAFPGNGTGVGQWFSDNVGYPIATTMRSYLNKIIKMINDQLKSLNYTRTGVSNNIGGAVAAIQLLNYIPAFATGAVIPPNAPFLGIMGDQRHGTNIETPEDLLRKIVREESGRGSYEFTAQINRRTLFDEIIDEGKLRKSATGYNPFEV